MAHIRTRRPLFPRVSTGYLCGWVYSFTLASRIATHVPSLPLLPAVRATAADRPNPVGTAVTCPGCGTVWTRTSPGFTRYCTDQCAVDDLPF